MVLVLGTLGSLLPGWAQGASNFQKAIVRLDRMAKGLTTGGTVCIAPNTATSISSVTVVFPSTTSAFTLNTTLANWTVNTNGNPDSISSGGLYWPSSATGLTGIGTATTADNTTKTVVFPVSPAFAPTVGNMYCFNFSGTNTLTNGGTAAPNLQGSVTTKDSGSAQIDTSNVAFVVVDITGSPALANDQVVINATVPPIFNFQISSTTDSIPATGNLDYTAVNESAGVTVTVNTNAKQGWVAWAKDTNQGLKSASAGNYLIPSVPWAASGGNGVPTTIATGTEKYGLVVALGTTGTSTCTAAVAPEYNAGANQVGAFEPNFQQIGSCTGGTSAGDQLVLKERATIKSTTPAATDYTDTMTVVGAGTF